MNRDTFHNLPLFVKKNMIVFNYGHTKRTIVCIHDDAPIAHNHQTTSHEFCL